MRSGLRATSSIVLMALALLASACGSTSTIETGAGQRADGSPCEPGPSADAGVDDTIEPNRRAEALVLHLTGIDELAITEENEGDEILYDDPNYGGVYGDFEGGLVVAVVDCSLVDADRIAQIAGGPETLTLIEVPYAFEEVNGFRDTLVSQLRAAGASFDVLIDSTVTGRWIRVVGEDLSALPARFGETVPDDVYTVEEGATFKPMVQELGES